MQPELLEQINTNYFKAEALCWGFSECSWWSLIASFVNLWCELLSRCAEQGSSEERESPTVHSHHAPQHPCTTSVCSRVCKLQWGMDLMLSVLWGWEVSKMSLPSRIGPRSDLCFRRKYSFTTNEKRKEFGIHKLDTGETSKQEDWMFLSQCSFSTLFHQGRGFIPFSKAAFPWSLPYSFTRHSSCSLQP